MYGKASANAWLGPRVGWDVVSGSHQSEVRSVSQVNEDSDIALTYTCRGKVQKTNKASASTFVWEKAAPLVFALKSENSVLPCLSLAPFEP